MADIEYQILSSVEKYAFLEEYKDVLKTDPLYSFKLFCDERGVKSSKMSDWMKRRGIHVKVLQAEAKGAGLCSHPDTFIQFKAGSRPSCTEDTLKGVSITFADGVNLTLQESSVKGVISLLAVYSSRCNRGGGANVCLD